MTLETNPRNLETVTDDAVDDPVVEVSSDSDEETPSETAKAQEAKAEETETLTKEQAEKLANDRLSKAQKSWDIQDAATKRQIAQANKTLEATNQRIKALEAQAAEAQRRADQAEREALGDSPDALSIYEAKLKARTSLEEAERIKAEAQSKLAEAESEISEARTYRTQKAADKIAAEAGVDAALLIQLTDGSTEKMEALAKVLPRKEAGDDKPNLQKPPKPAETRKSGITSTKGLSIAQREKMSNADYFAAREAEERGNGRR